jgi:hypothetical protein
MLIVLKARRTYLTQAALEAKERAAAEKVALRTTISQLSTHIPTSQAELALKEQKAKKKAGKLALEVIVSQ